MPGSTPWGKRVVADHVASVADLRLTADVGCGSGVWADLLGHGIMVGVEIHSPYAAAYGLEAKYRLLMLADLRRLTFQDWHGWDYVIMGDVLEHLPISTAQKIVARRTAWGKRLLVGVPYLSPQPPSLGNPHEEHLQPDLTPAVMVERYPGLRPLLRGERYGYWVNYDADELTTDEEERHEA